MVEAHQSVGSFGKDLLLLKNDDFWNAVYAAMSSPDQKLELTNVNISGERKQIIKVTDETYENVRKFWALDSRSQLLVLSALTMKKTGPEWAPQAAQLALETLARLNPGEDIPKLVEETKEEFYDYILLDYGADHLERLEQAYDQITREGERTGGERTLSGFRQVMAKPGRTKSAVLEDFYLDETVFNYAFGLSVSTADFLAAVTILRKAISEDKILRRRSPKARFRRAREESLSGDFGLSPLTFTPMPEDLPDEYAALSVPTIEDV